VEATAPEPVRIEGLAAGGEGVGRLADGLTVFVPASAPGDLVHVRIAERRRRHARAEILEIVEPGPARVAPRCPVFGRCGGCTWQHIDYPAQVLAKRVILQDALRRIGGIALAEPPEVLASPSAYGYRSRARVLVRGGAVGYRARRSHALCAVRSCPILVSGLDARLARLADEAAADSRPGECEWELSSGADGERATRLDLDTAHDASSQDPPATVIDAGGERLALSPGTFAQGNALLLGPLHAAVCRHVVGGRSLLELYAGAGFFSLALARRFDSVQLVESSPGAVADLRRNLATAGLGHVVVTPMRVEDALPDHLCGVPDVVLLDPPRAGLDEATLVELARLAPTRIVYLSCDPATLSRDIARFKARGYGLASVEGFDLFPQTPHVEALAVLEQREEPA
jgi:23S rRNA (uracil1939-C5)-methyltransferase